MTFALPPAADDPTYLAPGAQAAKVRAEVADKRRAQAERTRGAQDRAQHNAALTAALEREEQERETREKQNIKFVMEAAAKQQNIVAVNGRDFQSEEARRSELMNRRAHQEFEYTFLQLHKATPAAGAAGAMERRRLMKDSVVFIDPNSDLPATASAPAAARMQCYGHDEHDVVRGSAAGAGAEGGGGGRHWWVPEPAVGAGNAPRPRELPTDSIQTSAVAEKKK